MAVRVPAGCMGGWVEGEEDEGCSSGWLLSCPCSGSDPWTEGPSYLLVEPKVSGTMTGNAWILTNTWGGREGPASCGMALE